MKRLCALAMVVMLAGCGGEDPAVRAGLELRSAVLGAKEIRFEAEISARYDETVEEFSLDCSAGSDGKLTFTVTEPEVIHGITGTVSGTEGALTFDDTVLAFPLLADDRLSPVSAPWVLLKALRSGNLIACVQEGELLHLTIDDTYGDDPLTVDLWADGKQIEEAEISWRGKRILTMEIEDFTLL